MTSVKTFRTDQPPQADSLGRGAFVFTDDYSVFDWGKMPDEIPRKGQSLCTMGAYNFELLESAGVSTHYRGVVLDGEVCSLDTALSAGTPPREMAIDLTQVPELPRDDAGYDYEAYHRDAGQNYLIPLEIVFRNRVPVGSSLRSRSVPADHGLDIEEWPDRPVDLPEPVVEFSTKYEKQDRYLSPDEAAEIAGEASLAELEEIAREVNRTVTDRATEAGFIHQDGKIECLYIDGEIRVADVVGTFDENRFAVEGQQLSKELLRQYHRHAQPEWVKAVSEAKAAAKRDGIHDWKAHCEQTPDPLPDTVIQTASEMYAAGTNAYLDENLFDTPPIRELLGELKNL